MLSALIGAGSNIIGGLLGSRDKDKDRKMQVQFAKQGIQWKVEDAKKAGVHPLYALGAQTNSFAPVSVGSSDIGSGIAAAGQDISRAVAAGSSPDQRTTAFDQTVRALTLDKMALENDHLRSQIAKLNAPAVPPPIPTASQRYLIDGQGPTALIKEGPLKRVRGAPESPHTEPGAVTDVGHVRTARGGYAPVMSEDAKQRLEEDWPGMLLWNFRNRLLPSVGLNNFASPPQAPLPPGYDAWIYNPFTQEYTPHRKGPLGIYY